MMVMMVMMMMMMMMTMMMHLQSAMAHDGCRPKAGPFSRAVIILVSTKAVCRQLYAPLADRMFFKLAQPELRIDTSFAV